MYAYLDTGPFTGLRAIKARLCKWFPLSTPLGPTSEVAWQRIFQLNNVPKIWGQEMF